MKHSTGLLCALFLFCLPAVTLASNARDYIPVPPGTKMLVLYYDMKYGDELYVDSDKVSNNMDLDVNLGIIRPIYYTQIGGMLVAPQFILPFGSLELNDLKSSGLGDLQAACAFFLINNMKDKFYLTYMPFVTLPIGEYDREKAVNLGSNRWSTKQELAIGKGFGEKVWLEWITSLEFFFDNDDANGVNNRSVDSSRDALYRSETHLSYSFTKSFFASIDHYFTYGGETDLDGVDQNDETQTHTLGLAFFFMLNDHTQAVVDFRHDLDVENGIKADEIVFRFTYVF